MTSSRSTRQTPSGATVLTAKGRLDFRTADDLRAQLRGILDSGALHIVVDLSGVDSVDSAGIGALVSGLKAARRGGGDLRLVAPNSAVAAALEMLNLDKILIACDSNEDAFPHPA